MAPKERRRRLVTRCSWMGTGIGMVLFLALLAGCSNKGGREGKVNVVVSKRLEEQGVSVVDWRYSSSDKSFGVKLKASKELSKHTYLTVSGPGIGNAGSPIPMGEKINKGEWIDFGGSKALGNPFDSFPESGTITI